MGAYGCLGLRVLRGSGFCWYQSGGTLTLVALVLRVGARSWANGSFGSSSLGSGGGRWRCSVNRRLLRPAGNQTLNFN